MKKRNSMKKWNMGLNAKSMTLKCNKCEEVKSQQNKDVFAILNQDS